jgi:hypothetical protein
MGYTRHEQGFCPKAPSIPVRVPPHTVAPFRNRVFPDCRSGVAP